MTVLMRLAHVRPPSLSLPDLRWMQRRLTLRPEHRGAKTLSARCFEDTVDKTTPKSDCLSLHVYVPAMVSAVRIYFDVT